MALIILTYISFSVSQYIRDRHTFPFVSSVKKYKKMCKVFIKMHVAIINTLVQVMYYGFGVFHTDGSGVFG
jgi:hypothetical protein